MRHKSSFFRGDNSWKDFHELNQKVIYIEEADLNEKGEGGLRFEEKSLIGEIYIAGGGYPREYFPQIRRFTQSF